MISPVPMMTATADNLTDPFGRRRVANVHVTMLRAKRMRMTESGLKSSNGASRANHDRVFGKRRLRICASDESLVLRTDLVRGLELDAAPALVGVGPSPSRLDVMGPLSSP